MLEVTALCNFYPRSPCGERLQPFGVIPLDASISIHALLAESDFERFCARLVAGSISIHALLAESDYARSFVINWAKIFLSTLSLRRATTAAPMAALTPCTFLSTLSLRRATYRSRYPQHQHKHFYPRSPCGERPPTPQPLRPQTRHFYPRSPCGERPMVLVVVVRDNFISIHALLAESDRIIAKEYDWDALFLSTLSLRRATL